MADPEVDPKEDESPEDKPAEKPKPKPRPSPVEADPEEMTLEELLAERARMQKALKAANQEAASGRDARKRLQEIKDEEEQRRQDKLTEEEKAKVREAAMAQKLREAEEKASKAEEARRRLVIDREIEDEAKAVGIDQPRMAVKMIRGEGYAGIDFDDETEKATGVKAAVAAIVKEFPGLVTGSIRSGGGTPFRPSGDRPAPGGPRKTEADVVQERDTADLQRLSKAVGYSL